MQPSTRLGRVVQVVELLADPTGGALLAARPTVLLAGGLHGDDAASTFFLPFQPLLPLCDGCRVCALRFGRGVAVLVPQW
jgi:hypothetical protein